MVTTNNSEPPDREEDQQVDDRKHPIAESSEIEEFFQRLPGNFRWPKPNAEAVAAAVEAIHRMSGSAAAQDLASAGDADESGSACKACGSLLPAGARFCISCGSPIKPAGGETTTPTRADNGQHHFHHHYHHL